MSEPKEELKKILAESFKETIGESTPEETPDSVAKLQKDIETRIEAESIGAEFLEKLKDVAVSRRELREAEEDITRSLSGLQEIVNMLSGKIDDLAELKKANLLLERDVLRDIKAKLEKQVK